MNKCLSTVGTAYNRFQRSAEKHWGANPFGSSGIRVNISVTDFLPHAKLLMHMEWQEKMNYCDCNNFYAINPTVGVTKQNSSLSQRGAITINRLQIGHTRATHAHLGGDDEAFCTTCYTSLTVNHILVECPQLNHLRKQYHFGSTLKELLKHYIILNLKWKML